MGYPALLNSLAVVRNRMQHVAAQGPTKLGVAFAIGFVISLWSANSGDALNLVYGEPEKRGFIKLNLVSLAFTFAAIGFVLAATALIVALPAAFSATGTGGAMALVGKIARWPVLLFVIDCALAIIYRYGPSRREPKWRWITWGSGFAGCAAVPVNVSDLGVLPEINELVVGCRVQAANVHFCAGFIKLCRESKLRGMFATIGIGRVVFIAGLSHARGTEAWCWPLQGLTCCGRRSRRQ